MKKLLIAAVVGLFGLAAFAEGEVYTNAIVEIASVPVYPTAGATILANAEDLRAIAVHSAGTAISITNNKPQEMWLPVGIATDIGLDTTTSTIVPSYTPVDSSTAFRLTSMSQTTDAETYQALPSYPSMVYGDVFTITSSTTNNSFVVTFIKKVIPR